MKIDPRPWREAQAASDGLWKAVVRPEAMYERPVPERHRLVFYLGHLEAFDWNLLAPALGLKAFRPDWDQLFSFGIDPVDGQLPHDQPRDWPTIAEIQAYNREVRERVGAALAEGGATLEQPCRLQVAVEHRWMHVETLAYLLHNLPLEHKQAGPAPNAGTQSTAEQAWQSVDAGFATLGQAPHRNFGWDNEFDQHTEEVAGFKVQRYKVTNGEYLAWVEAGAPPPHFWRRRNNAWWYQGMFGSVPLPLDQPVYVTQAEASAYAAWCGLRLPTEAEWHRMAYGTPHEGERLWPWGKAAPQAERGNFGLQGWEPEAVTAHPGGASAWGVEDLIGNGWEWTATPFGPFPGFKAFDFYPGYSANFFDGKHYVMKGGSARTAVCLLRRSFRNWFQPHYPYVYAGFRCVSA